ncbi:hypothetical protein GCM10025881_10670 [Pseudolysinimonas kribbensis]|uniref:Acyltransferase 3 domain-containing protein n=1 Tax=Pseudolysinimonas kribbensis TaxID=433641 RepID=A0ABQ6K0V8_9MICO|nr:hypothetical protein [Pseudolysinimonas kribbensis]GMA94243.1 hypothetical protein GCM10025881_10670 [Pseudolysinimonas kribbensis]
MSLREALNGHRNSLGIIRLVLAAFVILDHAFPLGGWGEAPFLAMTRQQQSLGEWPCSASSRSAATW